MLPASGRALLLVLLGGALGSGARWLVARALDRWFAATGLPLGILLVNVLGCLVIGIVLGVSARGQPVASENARLLLATGVCGGFTTFSTFSIHTLELLQAGRTSAALLYVVLSVGAGLAATGLGLGIARLAG